MRLVLDTNCIVSAFLWGGVPYKIIEAAVDGQCQLFTSGSLLAELEDVLSREKFAARFLSTQTGVTEILAVTADPDDDAVLACAIAAKTDLIISGDRHLLDLKTYQTIPIVTPAEALPRITTS